MLINVLKFEITNARKSGNKRRVDALTVWVGECERIGKDLDDEKVIAIGRKIVKNAKVMLESRPNEQTEYEINLVQSYLPEEREVVVDDIINQLIKENPEQWMLYVDSGKQEGWWVGQVMKATKGTAKPAEIRQKLLALV